MAIAAAVDKLVGDRAAFYKVCFYVNLGWSLHPAITHLTKRAFGERKR